jgi:hypothetical protein
MEKMPRLRLRDMVLEDHTTTSYECTIHYRETSRCAMDNKWCECQNPGFLAASGPGILLGVQRIIVLESQSAFLEQPPQYPLPM